MRLTGSTKNPEFKPKRQPVLFVNGGTTNILTTLYGDGSVFGKTKEDFAGYWEQDLLAMIESEDTKKDELLYMLYTLKEENPSRWERLSTYWKADEEVTVDLEATLKTLIGEGEPKEEDGDSKEGDVAPKKEDLPDACTQQKLSNSIAAYNKSVAMLGTDEDSKPMEEPSVSLVVQLFNYGFDVWVDGNRGSLYQRGKSEDQSEEDYWNFTFRNMALED